MDACLKCLPDSSILCLQVASSFQPCPAHLGVNSQPFPTPSQVPRLALASVGKVSCLGVQDFLALCPVLEKGISLHLPSGVLRTQPNFVQQRRESSLPSLRCWGTQPRVRCEGAVPSSPSAQPGAARSKTGSARRSSQPAGNSRVASGLFRVWLLGRQSPRASPPAGDSAAGGRGDVRAGEGRGRLLRLQAPRSLSQPARAPPPPSAAQRPRRPPPASARTCSPLRAPGPPPPPPRPTLSLPARRTPRAERRARSCARPIARRPWAG